MTPLRLRTCTLRPWLDADEGALLRHANDRRVSCWLRDSFPFPYGRDDARAWLACANLWTPPRYLAIEVGGEAVGGIGIDPQGDIFRRSAEIGYWLGHAFWGRGIVTEAVPAMCAHAFANFDIVRLYAGVFDGNTASVRVLEKAGFEFEGRLRSAVWKDGSLRDELVYALIR